MRTTLATALLLLFVSLDALGSWGAPFNFEQLGASCKAATPETQGTTTGSTFVMGNRAGWVTCTIDKPNHLYMNGGTVSEVTIWYRKGFTYNGGYIGPASPIPGYKPPPPPPSPVYGCTNNGRSPNYEVLASTYSYPAGTVKAKFYSGRFTQQVLCYLPARSVINDLYWVVQSQDG